MFSLISTPKMAEKLGYNAQYLSKLALAGKIPAVKRGRVWLFDEDKVQEFLAKKNVQKLLK
jgi:excisionase family DNA binding protein